MEHNSDDLLAKLLAAKLNHDYVSPLTAISNGLEIYKMGEEQHEDAIQLIDESLKNALRELQFNRIAFGSYGDEEQLSLNDVTQRIQNFLRSEHFTLDHISLNEPPFKYDAKLWYLCILCMRSSFTELTHLNISKTDQGWQLTATGNGMKTRQGEIRAENDWLQIAKVTSNTVQFPLLFTHADRLNYDIIFKRTDDERLIVNFWLDRDAV